MTRTPLRVIFLADTRPGHYHLAQGVIAALERIRPVEVTRIEVKRKWIVPTRWLRARINAKTFFPPRPPIVLGLNLFAKSSKRGFEPGRKGAL